MGVRMALWVVNDREVVLQIGCLESGFAGKRMILAKTNHKPVAADLFDVEIRMGKRQSDNRCINLAVKNLLGQLPCVSVSGAHSDSRE